MLTIYSERFERKARLIQASTLCPESKSQTHVQTFATKFWHVETFQTKIRQVQTFATKIWLLQTFATMMMIRRDFRDRSGGGATETSRLIFVMSRLSRPKNSARLQVEKSRGRANIKGKNSLERLGLWKQSEKYNGGEKRVRKEMPSEIF